MKCPVDGTTLALAERAGVEIDYCPECHGLWLDRGELDRIIERSARCTTRRGTTTIATTTTINGTDREAAGRVVLSAP